MTAEELCVSSETAKRLHDAGIKVDSLYSWYIINSNHLLIATNRIVNQKSYGFNDPYYPAPTAEEFFKALPIHVLINDKSYTLRLFTWDDGVSAYYSYYPEREYLGCENLSKYEKLCEALADAAMKLKEAGYEL